MISAVSISVKPVVFLFEKKRCCDIPIWTVPPKSYGRANHRVFLLSLYDVLPPALYLKFSRDMVCNKLKIYLFHGVTVNRQGYVKG